MRWLFWLYVGMANFTGLFCLLLALKDARDKPRRVSSRELCVYVLLSMGSGFLWFVFWPWVGVMVLVDKREERQRREREEMQRREREEMQRQWDLELEREEAARQRALKLRGKKAYASLMRLRQEVERERRKRR